MAAKEHTPANPVATAAVDRLVSKRRASYANDAARLVNACRELIAETGEFDPPVGRILDRAGLSSRAFYRLFSSKDELLVAVLQDGTNRMVAHIEEAMACVDGPLPQIEAWVRSSLTPYGEGATSHSGSLLRYFTKLGEGIAGEVARIRDEFLRPLHDAITQLRPDDDEASIYRATEFIYYAYVGTVSKSETRNRPLAASDVDALCRCAALIATDFTLSSDIDPQAEGPRRG